MEVLLIDKTKAIYKGDIASGGFYTLLGALFIILALLFYKFDSTDSFDILVKTLSVLSILFFAKGIGLILFYRSRLNYYLTLEKLDPTLLNEEKSYTKFRLDKKARNRRVYLYVSLIGSVIAFFSLFSQQKHWMVGTLIPIVLGTSAEFCISLLTEFRLWEYLRCLEKNI